MQNKFIYLSGYKGGSKLTYNDFNTKLKDEDPELLALFPALKDSEKGKTCDDLFFAAVVPVVDDFSQAYNNAPEPNPTRSRLLKMPSRTNMTNILSVRTYLRSLDGVRMRSSSMI